MTTPTPGLPEAEKALQVVAYGFFGPWIERRKLDWRPRNKLWEPLVRLSDATALLASKDAEIERLRAVLTETRRVLEAENSKGVFSAIKDTIWRGPAETLFDYMDAALSAKAIGGEHV